jgi:hypothetical protein
MKQIEDDMTPFGFIDDGVSSGPTSYVDDDGQLWIVEDNEDGWTL